MSKYTIRMNFRKALDKATDLEEVSDDLKRLADNQLHDTLNELSASWTGENARMYIIKGGELREQLEDTSRHLSKTAQTIRQIAREIYEAEMEALRIAEERG